MLTPRALSLRMGTHREKSRLLRRQVYHFYITFAMDIQSVLDFILGCDCL
jgi:hypothetical protein